MTTPNDISLKEYFDTRLREQEAQFNIKIAALEKATTIAAGQMEKRLEGQNEFRGQLKDQVTTLVSKAEYAPQLARILEDIKTLSDTKAQFIGRPEHDGMLNKINDDIRVLRESKATLEGRASQSSVNVAMIIAVIGIILSIVGIVNRFVVSPTVPASPPAIVQPVK
jgi:hypothetical protein